MIQVSGNEYISLANIEERDGSIKYLTTLNMQHKGLFQIEGDSLISPFVKINNEIIDLANKLVWKRINYWIPQAIFETDNIIITFTYLAPKGHKAIALNVCVENKSNEDLDIEVGYILDWKRTFHVINESNLIDSPIIEKKSNWNHGKVYQQFNILPLIALALMDEGDKYKTLKPHESLSYDYFLGIGYDEVASSTAAKHLKRIGFDYLLKENVDYLNSKIIKNEDKFVEMIMNTNLFFAYYYSCGKTLDSEELVLVTSRSPRYYVSAAYWDRDSLLWSFPSILLMDEDLSRDILKYVYTVQINNVGEHSRFINGTLLEPGFELDELCAPVLALNSYIEKTSDNSILEESYIKEGLSLILKKLRSKKHPTINLYETFLMPTDDFTTEKYLTYNNVLVHKVFKILANYLNIDELNIEAELVKAAIYNHLVEYDMFIWSSDLNGHSSIYDEPPGSLQLLSYLDFCDKESSIFINTVNHIRSSDYNLSFANNKISEIGCNHAPHPWILSLCNSLLAGYGEKAIENIKLMKMDNYIACESIDEESGECTTGEAFATCAGFLAYSLNYYYLN